MNAVAVRNSLLRWTVLGLLALTASVAWAQVPGANSSTLERVRANGKLTMGFYAEARPYSYQDKAGNTDGYAIALCRQVANEVQAQLHLPSLATQFVAVDAAERFKAVKDGKIDLLCGPSAPTLKARTDVSFSIPILAGGTGVMLRKDGPTALRDVLETGQAPSGPIWRGSPMLAALQQRNFAVISGSLAEHLLRERREELKVNSVISSVPDLKTGLQQLTAGKADAFFAERNVLLDLAKQDTSGDVLVLKRTFDAEPLALAVNRDDADFRLLVDQVLSNLYRSGKVDAIYEQYLGKPDQATRDWFRKEALPE